MVRRCVVCCQVEVSASERSPVQRTSSEYIYIYIYMCVCVCVSLNVIKNNSNAPHLQLVGSRCQTNRLFLGYVFLDLRLYKRQVFYNAKDIFIFFWLFKLLKYVVKVDPVLGDFAPYNNGFSYPSFERIFCHRLQDRSL